MKRILFVDDEPNVLQGLQRMLRNLRQEWEMEFVGSGEEALERLGNRPFDVIVSDMRMPGMDGAQLLTEVMRRHPQIVRIILSGHSDYGNILKLVRPAHQYLAKPCDPEMLRSVIMRASALRELLGNGSIKQIVSRIESLPSLPAFYAEIIEELHSPDASLQKVGKIISRDVGMTAKILQLVNSAFFGLPHRVSSPSQAVSLLGLDTVKGLVLSVHIFDQFDSKKTPSLDLDRLWRHSFVTGVFAKILAREEKQKQVLIDHAFMAGLLHDVGKPILSTNFGREYEEIQVVARGKAIPLWEAEKQVLGASHSEVGAYLMGLWGLEDPIVEGLAFHHCPQKYHGQDFSPLLAVYVANSLEHGVSSTDPGEPLAGIDDSYLSTLGMADRLPLWSEACQRVVGEGEINE